MNCHFGLVAFHPLAISSVGIKCIIRRSTIDYIPKECRSGQRNGTPRESYYGQETRDLFQTVHLLISRTN